MCTFALRIANCGCDPCGCEIHTVYVQCENLVRRNESHTSIVSEVSADVNDCVLNIKRSICIPEHGAVVPSRVPAFRLMLRHPLAPNLSGHGL